MGHYVYHSPPCSNGIQSGATPVLSLYAFMVWTETLHLCYVLFVICLRSLMTFIWKHTLLYLQLDDFLIKIMAFWYSILVLWMSTNVLKESYCLHLVGRICRWNQLQCSFKMLVTTHKGSCSHNLEDHNFNLKIWYTNCHGNNIFILTKHVSLS